SLSAGASVAGLARAQDREGSAGAERGQGVEGEAGETETDENGAADNEAGEADKIEAGKIESAEGAVPASDGQSGVDGWGTKRQTDLGRSARVLRECASEPCTSHHSQDARTGASAARRLTPGRAQPGFRQCQPVRGSSGAGDPTLTEAMDARIYFEL